jgi:hypothetical protein
MAEAILFGKVQLLDYYLRPAITRQKKPKPVLKGVLKSVPVLNLNKTGYD